MAKDTTRGARSKALDQFLQPQSMMTPGILGSLTMVATNTLGMIFSIPMESRAYPALSLAFSLLFGLAVLVKTLSLRERLVYYVINSFVILSVATGSNILGQQASGIPAAHAAGMHVDAAAPAAKIQFFRQWYPPPQQAVPAPSVATSTICLFSTGPLSGQRLDLSPTPPQPVGQICSDGRGSVGKIVIR